MLFRLNLAAARFIGGSVLHDDILWGSLKKAPIILVGIFLASTASATIYKCQNAAGQIEYGGTPCANGHVGEPENKSWWNNLECWDYSPTAKDPQTRTRICFDATGHIANIDRKIER
ncbi:MAG: DUF4124 domain-containing protein [Burkholderiales bacterium]|jgi:hypothetical protein|nr:DUF4124 domain-containing protein [Burkholderiales bacterium]